MATLKTNYKDDILDTSVNTQRKYRMVNNADGTISLEDVTVYTQNGDSFGAADINKTNQEVLDLNSSLIANEKQFQFAYDAEKGSYGYLIDGTFKSFSDATALYEALQYSGLVTADMTYDQMLQVLAENFKYIPSNLFNNGFNTGSPIKTFTTTGGTSNYSVQIGSIIKLRLPWYGGNTWGAICSDKAVAFSSYSKVRIVGRAYGLGDSPSASVTFGFSSSKVTTSGGVSALTNLGTFTGNTTITIDKTLSVPTDATPKYLCFGLTENNCTREKILEISKIIFS